MEEKTKKVLLLSLQMVGDMGYCFQIEGMTQDKPERKIDMNRKSAKTILKVIKKGLFFFDQGTWSHEELMTYISGAYNAFAAVQCDNEIVETFYGWNCCNLLDPETMGDIRLAIADLETITMEDDE